MPAGGCCSFWMIAARVSEASGTRCALLPPRGDGNGVLHTEVEYDLESTDDCERGDGACDAADDRGECALLGPIP